MIIVQKQRNLVIVAWFIFDAPMRPNWQLIDLIRQFFKSVIFRSLK